LYGHSPEQGFIVGAVSYAAMSVAMVVAGIIGKAMPVKET
jgi:hypothetical protein